MPGERSTRNLRLLLVASLFGVFGFKGDACICGKAHRPPPSTEVAPAPTATPDDAGAPSTVP